MIAKAKLLHLKDFFEPFIAVTDAAKGQYACWAVYQRHKISKKLVPVVYGSQCFRKAMAKCLKYNINFFSFNHGFLISDCASLQYLVRWEGSATVLFNWNLCLCSLPISITPVSATSPLISWVDLFTRNTETKRKIQQKKEAFNDKSDLFQTPIIDFANLGAIPIEQLLDLIRKFQSFLKTKEERDLVHDNIHQFQDRNQDWLQDPDVVLRTTHFCLIYETKTKHYVAVYPGKIQQITAEGIKGQKHALGFMLKRHFPKMGYETLLYFQKKDPLCQRAMAELQKGANPKVSQNLGHPQRGNPEFCIIEDIYFF